MTDTTPPDGGRITDLLLEREMRESYLNYSMSVILSRALPDARDGLKPSQRRVLVAIPFQCFLMGHLLLLLLSSWRGLRVSWRLVRQHPQMNYPQTPFLRKVPSM